MKNKAEEKNKVETLEKVQVNISGQVQGVFYRVFIARKAKNLGVFGWVKNLDDGRVEAAFIGTKNQVNKMIKWCLQGPAGSKVQGIEKINEKSLSLKDREIKGFEIRY
ncbi:acylphosphatase [Patescibacteria group bacterium]